MKNLLAAIRANKKPTNSESKFHNQKVRGYDSKREYEHSLLLKDLAKKGEITDLQEQVEYILIPKQKDANGKVLEKPCKYRADFVYKDKEGNTVVEDVKGLRTREYIIKRKLMLSVHGIRIKEI